MIKTKWPEHGGKTTVISSVLNDQGIQEDPKLDLSANINPFGIPAIMMEAMQKTITNQSMYYPDLTYKEHTEKVARYENVSSNQVLLTNGGAEAIHLSASLFKGKKVAILQPTFSEYELACQAHDVSYTCYSYDDVWKNCLLPKNMDEIIANNDAIYICRPNNPSGTFISQRDFEQLVELTKASRTYLIVDEAFIHFVSTEKSAISFLKNHPYLIVLRSLTKIFAVPGIRLGYIMANSSIITRLQLHQVPWSVNAIALSLIDCMPACREYVERTASYITGEKEWLMTQLQSLGYEMSDTKTNFYLLRDASIQNHDIIWVFLAEKGILTRHTHNFKGLDGEALRIAIRTRKENEQVVAALREWRERS